MFIIVILYKLINIAMLAWSVPEGPSCIALGVIAGFGRNLLGDPCIWWDIGIRHGHGPLWLRGNWAKIQKIQGGPHEETWKFRPWIFPGWKQAILGGQWPVYVACICGICVSHATICQWLYWNPKWNQQDRVWKIVVQDVQFSFPRWHRHISKIS